MQRFRFIRAAVQTLLTYSSPTIKYTTSQQAEFFKYTSGRWLYNEKQQNASRYVCFNVDEIQRVACAAVGANRCIKFKKLDEGSYNKVFNLEFDNGAEAIARIPCIPLAGAPFLTTTSEVATLDFAREVLESHHRWPHIAKAREVFPLLNGVFDIERKLELAPFSQMRSLYFTNDVSPALRSRPLFRSDAFKDNADSDFELYAKLDAAKERYRTGPIADQWWSAERLQAFYDHGPWLDIPHQTSGHPYIIPPSPLSNPTIWHPDISHSNLLVAETGPAEVQGFIDWQHTVIAPYCMQATFTSIFTYDGGLIDIPNGRVVPQLPSRVSTLSAEQQDICRLHLKFAMRHKAYEQKIVEESKRRQVRAIASLDEDLDCGGDGWVSEYQFSTAMKMLKQRKASWDDVNGGPFPYKDGSFSFFPS
ncbi:hypothetical protein PILCRDRAFT_92748 [Piloderma croceum F 1598]|uniref:Altered inheritance of mitochondria protein 9, mitochondrial n=1 Tax=Piloderma croceum (strain F 1598) TaxID=765440 RepID=A0A0C3B9Y2_PILCF|nr:hypothetical protein PILCRDRAFT_92748 [Piloderma croceum F 1598]